MDYEEAVRKVLLTDRKPIEIQALDAITNTTICLGAIVDRLDKLIELLDKRL